jgi:hypothetical protein
MTKTTYTHLITLRPLDIFFFGSERTFGNDEGVNYSAETRRYPQQTTLLGLLRHLGYLDAGIGPDGIGESFVADKNVHHSTFGFIKAISPLFFQQQTTKPKPLYFGFADLKRKELQNAPARFNPAAAEVWQVTSNWNTLSELPAYNPKNWHPEILVSDQAAPVLLEDLVGDQ